MRSRTATTRSSRPLCCFWRRSSSSSTSSSTWSTSYSTRGSDTRDPGRHHGRARSRRGRQATLSGVDRTAPVRALLGRVHPAASARYCRRRPHHRDGRHGCARGPDRAVRPDRVQLRRSPPGALVPASPRDRSIRARSEEHTSELQSLAYLVCRLLLEKKTARLSFAKIPTPTVAAAPATNLCLINERRLTRAFS